MSSKVIAMLAVGGCAWLCAAPARGETQRVADCFDATGGRCTSAAYTIDGCSGGIGGVSTNAASGQWQTARHGFIGQITEVMALAVTGTPQVVDEGATSQLEGMALMDDETMTMLQGSEIAWSTPGYPIASIGGSGVATADIVYDEAEGEFTGWYAGKTGVGSLRVLDSDSDNYGSYAGDGLPDSWQNRYFGLDNPDAAPGADPDRDGHDNTFERIANLVPTNHASRFMLRAEGVPGQPNRKNIIFSPRYDTRTYIPEWGTNLMPGGYLTLTTTLTSDNGAERTVTDTNATGRAKFYRIKITNP